MHTFSRFFILALALVVYIALGHRFLMKPCCESSALPGDMDIGFAWNRTYPILGNHFSERIQSFADSLGAGETLLVTGLYFAAEAVPSGFPNAGFARAGSIAALLGKQVPSDRIEIRARLIEETEGIRNALFPGFIVETRSAAGGLEQTIEQLDDRIIIRFPYGSAEKNYDPEVDAFIAVLSEKIKESGDQLLITGHADNTGTPAFNLALSEARAKGIEAVFVAKGVPRDQLLTEARGDTQPIATNETERGRYNNRRVEVRWIKPTKYE